MSQRASCWSVTINNPTQTDEYNIAQGRQRGWKVEGQLEQGENGTPHYQLLVRTPQVRFSAVKSVFPRAHIEVARDSLALSRYVHKQDTRVAGLQVDQSRYPSQLQLFEWFSALYNKEYEKNFPDTANTKIIEAYKLDALKIFDDMAHKKIREGYMIGPEIMNPQIRAFIKRFGFSLALRHSQTRQTDRQPELFSRQGQNAAPQENATLQEETDDPPSSGDEDEGTSSE